MIAAAWRSAVLASLLSGTALGGAATRQLSSPAELDALATALADDLDPLRRGLAVRQAHLFAPGDDALPAETLALVAPLADRLGLARDKAVLEDLSFRHTDPAAYAELRKALSADDAAHLDAALADTRAMLADAGVDAVVTGRVKSLYSVHRKMARKDQPVASIVDRVGLRIRVRDEEACYAVRDLVHARHAPIVDEYDDYIAAPKANGYRSIHTAVTSALAGRPLEIQIRTHAMHDAAEQGDAAHWRYKLQTA